MNKLSIIIFSAGACVAVPAFGGAAAGGSTEATQILNNVQLTLSYLEQVHQTAQQLEQLKTQIEIHKIHIENAKQLSQGDIMIIDQYARQLWEHWQKQQGYAHTSSELDKLFRDKYPSYNDMLNGALDGESISNLLKKWNEATNNTLKGVLDENIKEREGIKSIEKAGIDELINSSREAGGDLAVLQVSNEIAKVQIEQIQGLRNVIMRQTDMIANFHAAEEAQQKAIAVKMSRMFAPVKVRDDIEYKDTRPKWPRKRRRR